MSLLRSAFAPRAVRIALTATPDYDDDRVLCRHFPRLIHEVTAEEAMALRLLAPARLWVAEVVAAGSTVTVRSTREPCDGSRGDALARRSPHPPPRYTPAAVAKPCSGVQKKSAAPSGTQSSYFSSLYL